MSTHAPDPILIESHHIIRSRTFTIERGLTDRSVERALRVLGMEQATGKLTLNLSNGTIGSIQFEEKQRISPGQ